MVKFMFEKQQRGRGRRKNWQVEGMTRALFGWSVDDEGATIRSEKYAGGSEEDIGASLRGVRTRVISGPLLCIWSLSFSRSES